jgi:membrane associated rhomboid family serine protease
MAYQQYDRGDYRPQFGGFKFFPPVIKNLLIINAVLWILQSMLIRSSFHVGDESAARWLQEMLYLNPLGQHFRPWQLLTYMFLHGDFYHVLFNMLPLWMFGMEVENTWGSRKFLWFYIACGIAGGLTNLLIAPLFTAVGPTIGASGSIYGVLVAFAMLFPNRYIYLWFLLPVKAKYFVTVFVMVELYYGVTGTPDGVAHMAHLGGALLGGVWVLLDARGLIDRLLARGGASVRRAAPGVSRPRTAPVQDATIIDMPPPRPETRPDNEHARYQKVIDEILDKISVSGYTSLTEQEKRILLDASKRIHPDKGSSDA